MDSACRLLVEIIKQEAGLSLGQLVEGSGFARQTVFNHLQHLLKQDAITKDIQIQPKRGRPRVTYAKSVHKIDKKPDSVTLSFNRLSDICRHKSGGWCKPFKHKCEQSKCHLKTSNIH